MMMATATAIRRIDHRANMPHRCACAQKRRPQSRQRHGAIDVSRRKRRSIPFREREKRTSSDPHDGHVDDFVVLMTDGIVR